MKNIVALEVIKFPGLLPKWIPNEQTLVTASSKLIFVFRRAFVSNISNQKYIENTKMVWYSATYCKVSGVEVKESVSDL